MHLFKSLVGALGAVPFTERRACDRSYIISRLCLTDIDIYMTISKSLRTIFKKGATYRSVLPKRSKRNLKCIIVIISLPTLK